MPADASAVQIAPLRSSRRVLRLAPDRPAGSSPARHLQITRPARIRRHPVAGSGYPHAVSARRKATELTAYGSTTTSAVISPNVGHSTACHSRTNTSPSSVRITSAYQGRQWARHRGVLVAAEHGSAAAVAALVLSSARADLAPAVCQLVLNSSTKAYSEWPDAARLFSTIWPTMLLRDSPPPMIQNHGFTRKCKSKDQISAHATT